ncbi:MAG: phosphosulfolactate synthase [Methanobrevibacter sp.]|jgi:phosphosulfolactate synthase|nr:phosphosulfolactate synthase [Methanobrevibacter sp.]
MNAFDFLLPKREKGPENGLTMVLDKGIGLNTAKDLMEISGEYVDFLKFGWGTITLHNREIIKNKVEMYKSFDIKPYPGGTLFEIAYKDNKITQYFEYLEKLVFNTLEISDGTINIKISDKLDLIQKAKDNGFYVLSEVGKKDITADHEIDLDTRIETIKSELKSGANKVIIEAREGGKNIGIFDEKGDVKEEEVNEIIKKINPDDLIWEAPNKDQQTYFVLKLGQNVNLGNININDITSLETIRRGLRGDTLGKI